MTANITVAVVRNSAGDLVDECWTWEAAQSYANDGYTVEAVAADGHMTAAQIQSLCDYELRCALDCFGPSWAK